jgi:hypothetical protein
MSILYVSGASEYFYLQVYTHPKAKLIGKTIFGIGQSVIGAVIYGILTTQTGFDINLMFRYIILFIIGFAMIVFGTILED